MASPYLASDETVALATDGIVFRSAPLSALILTNKRLLLIQAVGDTISADEILVSKIRTAGTSEGQTPEPVLRLTFVTEKGEVKQENLTFTNKEGKARTEECKEWAEKITEQILPSLAEVPLQRIPLSAKEPEKDLDASDATPEPAIPPKSKEPKKPEKIPAAGPAVPAASSADILAKHDRLSGLSFPSIPKIDTSETQESRQAFPKRRALIAVVAVLALVFAVIVGIYLLNNALVPKQIQPVVPQVQNTPAVAGGPAETPVAAATPEQTLTPIPSPSAPVTDNTTQTLAPATPVLPLPAQTQAYPDTALPVPVTGVWARVKYAGNYTGTVGAGGDNKPVSGTGENYYQLVTKTGTARVIIQKTEGTSDLLVVDIYRDGVLLKHGETSRPRGEVNIQAELAGESQAKTPVLNITPVNTTASG
jgi:hypothetical protein